MSPLAAVQPAAPPGLLARMGLSRPELVAWSLYDWANSVFMTTVMQVFPIYFATVAAAGLAPAEATARFAGATAVGMALMALLGPPLGAMADYSGSKKKMLAFFIGVGVLSTGAMVFVGPGQWVLGAVLFVLGNVGATGSFAFYDSLLPHVAREHEVDQVSTAGYALGYLGGGLLLTMNLLWIQKPHLFGFADGGAATRASFLSAAVWWLVFSIPLFRKVPEPPRRLVSGEQAGASLVLASFTRLRTTFHELKQYRQAALMLLAFLIYNDGINTIIRMATSYGTEIGLGREALITAIVIAQFMGFPFAFLFGAVAARVGPKTAIFGGLAAYVVISTLGFFMTNATQFLILAGLVGMVQGGCQALSRSVFSTMIPRHKSSEFFAFYGVFDKFAGVVGPALFAAVAGTIGSSRPAILALIAFFAVGALILSRVDIEAGRRAAREMEARAAEA